MVGQRVNLKIISSTNSILSHLINEIEMMKSLHLSLYFLNYWLSKSLITLFLASEREATTLAVIGIIRGPFNQLSRSKDLRVHYILR